MKLRDLPDLQSGDLLLFQDSKPLYMCGADRAYWLHTSWERQVLQQCVPSDAWSPRASRSAGCDVTEVSRLRGVTPADFADDRWPDTLARLRAAGPLVPPVEAPASPPVPPGAAVSHLLGLDVSAPTAPEPEPQPVQVGDRVVPEDVTRLPPGTVLHLDRDDPDWLMQVGHDGHWRSARIVAGYLRAGYRLDPMRGRDRLRGPGTVVALGAPLGDDRRALVEHVAAAGYEPARAALREAFPSKRTPPAVKVGDVVTAEQAAKLPAGVVLRVASGAYQWVDGTGTGTYCRLTRVMFGDNWLPTGTDLERGEVVALGVPEPASRLALAESLARAGVADVAAELAAFRVSKPPEPGQRVEREDLDRLPVGAVVDTQDGSGAPWARKCEDGMWRCVGRFVLEFSDWSAATLDRSPGTLVALDSPSEPAALRAWCAERGYRKAIEIETELTARAAAAADDARKQSLDAAPAAVQDGGMTIGTISPRKTHTFTQASDESDADFEARIARMRAAVAPTTQQTAPVAQTAQPSALARLGAALQRVGQDFARDGVAALVEQKTLVAVDASRVLAHKGVVAAAEALAGEAGGVAALRVVQHPLAALVEDAALAVGLGLAGKDRAAGIVRGRLLARAVGGVSDATVARGSAVVTQLAQAVGALVAGVDAAELPAGEQTEGEVRQ